jgi:hypothetical protein
VFSHIAKEKTQNKILLITNNTPPPWTLEFASHLRQRGHYVDLETLDGEPSADQDVFYLLDLDYAYLQHMSEERFGCLQSHVSAAKSQVVWVTQSSQLSCGDPSYGLVFGFARTLRKEMGLDISVFESDSFDAATADSLGRVYEKIKRSRDSQDVDPEYEFSYSDGAVYVGRCHWASLSDGANFEPTEKMVTKLDISNYGLLDCMHWTEAPAKHMSSQQVEIEIRCIGLNFRVSTWIRQWVVTLIVY